MLINHKRLSVVLALVQITKSNEIPVMHVAIMGLTYS